MADYSNNGTCIPGMNVNPKDEEKRSGREIDAPVVGFLYSISRGVTEYWPLQLGENTIGRDEECDIVLNEQTISGRHANILVQKQKKSGEVVAVVRVDAAKNPILVNDEDIDIRLGSECKNGTVISLGEHYKLYVVLINAEAVGLSSDPAFAEAATIENEPDDFIPSPNKPVNPYNRKRGGTVSLDGGSIEESGGTKFM